MRTMQMSAAIESLFSVRAADSDWVNDAARCILRVLGPSTADWWAVDWHRTGERTTAGTLAADSSMGMAMGSGFPATTHVDLPARMARGGGLTTVTAAGLWTEHARDFFSDMRRGDAVAVNVAQPDRGFVVGRLLRKRAPHPPGDRRLLAPVMRSVSLAWRARKYLALGPMEQVADAVFRPTGTVLHATSAVKDRPALQALRAAVVAREERRRTTGPSVAGVALWSNLVEGRWSLVDDHEESGQRYVLAVRNDAYADVVALTRREALAVDLAIRGRSAKECVDELGVSLSAVYGLRHGAAKKLSVGSLADVVALGRQLAGVQLTFTALGDQSLVALRMPAAISRLSCLTPAEREVGIDLLRALPQREIARRRGRSLRTIANQVASIYRKLQVGDRTEFVAHVKGGGRSALSVRLRDP